MPDKLLERTRGSRRDFFAQHGERLTRLAHEGQTPQLLFITCSDSRLTMELLFGLQPGDAFMIRNAGNIVPPYGPDESGVLAAIEFAVHVLRIPHLIVCGHTDCGALRALDKPIDAGNFPALVRWLDLARPAQQAVDATAGDLAAAARHQAIVERNVVHQLENLRRYPFVREQLAQGNLTLHGWVYDLYSLDVSYYDQESGRFHRT